MQWLNEPPHWQQQGTVLHVTTGNETDFWRTTFYGFVRDTGHFYHQAVPGDFTADVAFSGEYTGLYDQAGLMMRVDETAWIKAGIEFTNGKLHLSAVVTRDLSDWSVLPLEGHPEEVFLRVTRHAEAIRIQYSLDGRDYHLLRLAPLPTPDVTLVGPMCCSPQRAGFQARFRDFRVGPAISRELHG